MDLQTSNSLINIIMLLRMIDHYHHDDYDDEVDVVEVCCPDLTWHPLVSLLNLTTPTHSPTHHKQEKTEKRSHTTHGGHHKNVTPKTEQTRPH